MKRKHLGRGVVINDGEQGIIERMRRGGNKKRVILVHQFGRAQATHYIDAHQCMISYFPKYKPTNNIITLLLHILGIINNNTCHLHHQIQIQSWSKLCVRSCKEEDRIWEGES